MLWRDAPRSPSPGLLWACARCPRLHSILLRAHSVGGTRLCKARWACQLSDKNNSVAWKSVSMLQWERTSEGAVPCIRAPPTFSINILVSNNWARSALVLIGSIFCLFIFYLTVLSVLWDMSDDMIPSVLEKNVEDSGCGFISAAILREFRETSSYPVEILTNSSWARSRNSAAHFARHFMVGSVATKIYCCQGFNQREREKKTEFWR